MTIFTSENFENEVLKSNSPVLVDFWAPWCGPCQMMGPIVEELEKEYSGHLPAGQAGNISAATALEIPSFAPDASKLAPVGSLGIIKIGKCNVDENTDLAEKYGILSIPAFLIFKDGKVSDQMVGGVAKGKLAELINRNI